MALTVDAIDEYGPSNIMHHQLQPKKTKVSRLYNKKFYPPYIVHKMEHFNLKSG